MLISDRVVSPVAVDFETYYTSACSLKTMSVYEYVHHELFDPYLVAFHAPDLAYVGPPAEAPWHLLHGRTWLMHNAGFDSVVWERMQELRPDLYAHIQPLNYVCTADLVAYQRCTRALAFAAKHFLGITANKGVRDALKNKSWDAIKGGDPAFYREVLAYGGEDARLCYTLWEKLGPSWPADEFLVSQLSREGGKTGVRVDLSRLKADLDSLSRRLFNLERHIPWDWDPNKTPLSIQKLREACRAADIPCPASVAEDDPDCVAWEEQYAGKYPWINAIRHWRKVNRLVKLLRAMARGTYAGRFPFALKYFAAATGRWGGSERFNMQNLSKFDPRNPEATYGVDIRGYLLPELGCDMMISDYEQIEARKLWYLAGDTVSTDLLRRGLNPYEVHAVAAMGWDPARKLKTEDPALYTMAKVRVLLLGYKGGKGAILRAARAYGLSEDMTEDRAQAIVNEYRLSSPLVRRFWGSMQRAIEDAVNRKEEVLSLILPSGRRLTYRNPVAIPPKDAGDWTRYTAFYVLGDKAPRFIHSGLLTENVVQATCRDILVDGWCRLHRAGIPVAWTVHDEFVLTTVPEGPPGVPYFKEAHRLLSVPPDWAKDFPLSVESKLTKRYTK